MVRFIDDVIPSFFNRFDDYKYKLKIKKNYYNKISRNLNCSIYL